MAEPSVDVARQVELLEAELKRLESEYHMFFGGRSPRPPWETRSRVAALVKRLDRMPSSNYGVRFRFTTLQARFMTFVRLWDRNLRAREEGRAGPLPSSDSDVEQATPSGDRVLAVATVSDPTRDMDTVQNLFERLVSARREAGQEAIPFQKFAEQIEMQVGAFRGKGYGEVVFCVALKDGKVTFDARAMRGAEESEG